MNGRLMKIIFVMAALLMCEARVEAQYIVTFQVNVTSSSLPAAQFQPFTFDQTWTLSAWNGSAPDLDDLGGGASLTKATASTNAIVSPSPVMSQVLAAANISAGELSPYLYAENGIYSSGGGDCDFQFKDQATELVPNGDGTFQYENYDVSLYYNFGLTSPVVALTPEVIESYLAAAPTTSWGESGSDYLDPNDYTLGTALSSLSYSGTATFISLEETPEPRTCWLLLGGGLLSVLARRFAAFIR